MELVARLSDRLELMRHGEDSLELRVTTEPFPGATQLHRIRIPIEDLREGLAVLGLALDRQTLPPR